MILVDTSVWIQHPREDSTHLRKILLAEQVVTHPFVAGEIACGSISNRRHVLALLGNLPQNTVGDHQEVLALLEEARLYGKGIGWVDAHLLCSALLSKTPLWTLDRRLQTVASSLRIAYSPVAR